MDFSDKLSIAKMVIRWTVIGGTSKIVNGIVKNNTDPETLSEKVQIFAGSFAIGGMVANVVGDHTDEKVDEIIVWTKKAKDEYDKKQAESK